MVLLQQQNQLERVMETNRSTERFGLTLTEEDARLILEEHKNSLREQKRVEFGAGIAEKIIEEFCDSAYISQDSYVETIIRLQEIFYLYKNEMQDEITDGELLHLMKEQFEELCFGDLEYLEGTCLANFAQAIRAGYDDCLSLQEQGAYARFEEVKRWDHELYLQALRELCWG